MNLFSQRYGYTSPQKAFQRETVSDELRRALWNVLNLHIWEEWVPPRAGAPPRPATKRIDRFLERLWIRFFNADLDSLPPFRTRDSQPGAYDLIKQYFFECKWYKVFDFLDFMLKDTDSLISDDLAALIQERLEQENSAYRLVGRQVVEITDENQIAAVEKALEIPTPPVREHFQKALSMLSDKTDPDYRNSIKESILAVEAACRVISNNPKATLEDALKRIPNLHSALRQGFSKLYAYTSDADGIRHALTEKSDVTKADATFMLVSCSAFVSFLYEKAQAEGS